MSANPTTPVLYLIVTARIVSSANPASAVTLCTDGTILDNGQHERHDGLFRGAILPLQSTTDPARSIPIAFLGSPNYGSVPNASLNLRERPWMRFETVPPLGEGVLVIKHDLSLERIFEYSRDLKVDGVQRGEKFRIKMNPKRAFMSEWWAFGGLGDGELSGKIFAKWERPNQNGDISNLMPGEQKPNVEQMEKEGWVFSEVFDDLEMAEDIARQSVIIEFTD